MLEAIAKDLASRNRWLQHVVPLAAVLVSGALSFFTALSVARHTVDEEARQSFSNSLREFQFHAQAVIDLVEVVVDSAINSGKPVSRTASLSEHEAGLLSIVDTIGASRCRLQSPASLEELQETLFDLSDKIDILQNPRSIPDDIILAATDAEDAVVAAQLQMERVSATIRRGISC